MTVFILQDRAEQLQQTPYCPQRLKYSLSRPLQERFADPCSNVPFLFGRHQRDCISPSLASCHWLFQRISFDQCFLKFNFISFLLKTINPPNLKTYSLNARQNFLSDSLLFTTIKQQEKNCPVRYLWKASKVTIMKTMETLFSPKVFGLQGYGP